MKRKLTLILIAGFISIGFWQFLEMPIYSQNRALTLVQVINSLTVSNDKKKESAITAKKVRQVGVSFPLTRETEATLRFYGATDELIKAIRQNSPPLPKQPQQIKGTAEIIVENANLRKSPNGSSEVIREVSFGERFFLSDSQPVGAWYMIFDAKTGKEGWLHGNTFKLVTLNKSNNSKIFKNSIGNKTANAEIKRGVTPVADAEIAVIEMENAAAFGTIKIELYSNIAPKMVARFKNLAREGVYNGTTFHRINQSVIQGGDPNSKDNDPDNDGVGESEKPDVPAEFSDIPFDTGIVGAARSMDENSANSQFFITLKREAGFDNRYTIFGKVIEGMNNVRTISGVNPKQGDRPIEDVRIKSITIRRNNFSASGKEMKNSIGMEFVYIPSGSFEMGSNDGDSDEKPVHRVTISKDFYMGKYEVTQEEYEKVMGKNPSYFKNCPRCPVESVNWNAAQEFIKRLNAKNEGTYRLPTEAEWEYACRAGTTTKWSFGNDENQIGVYA